MKTRNILSLFGTATLALLSFSFLTNKREKNETKFTNGKPIAVVELFTSEGCSSCPAADEAIIKLAKEFPENVYFLGYHVDYWNYIGWTDEFSNANYTKRQQKYAQVFGLNTIYTPQVIVNGENELVGSNEYQLRTTISQKLRDSTSSGIELKAKKTGENGITVSYRVANTSKVFLNVALIQLKATTNVKRGENGGHQLHHINVVRELKTIAIDKAAYGSIDFSIPADLSSKDIKFIAFIQNQNSLKITGATDTAPE